MSRLTLFYAAVLAAVLSTVPAAEMTAHCEKDRLVLNLPAGGDGE